MKTCCTIRIRLKEWQAGCALSFLLLTPLSFALSTARDRKTHGKSCWRLHGAVINASIAQGEKQPLRNFAFSFITKQDLSILS
jgi:hypothetical protein